LANHFWEAKCNGFPVKNPISMRYGYMEKGPVITLNEVFADTIWLYSRYHGRAYERKIWPVVTIFAHQWFFRTLISTRLLEVSRLKD
jgi:hypothetical protein